MIIDNVGIEGFSERLRNLIEKSDKKTPEIASCVGIKKAALYRLSDKNGYFGLTVPSSDTLLKLSAFFEVSPFWLLFGSKYEDIFLNKDNQIEKAKIDSEIETVKEENKILKDKNESLEKELERYKRIFATCNRKVTDLFKDFEDLQATL